MSWQDDHPFSRTATDGTEQGTSPPNDRGGWSRRRFLALSAVVGVGSAAPVWLHSQRADGTTAVWHPMNMKAGPAHNMAGMVADVAATPVPPFTQSPPLAKFVQPLRGVFPIDPNGIPVAQPDGKRSYPRAGLVVDHYTYDINQFPDTLHPDMGPTTLWGYHSVNNLGGPVGQRHLGGILVGERGKPIQITFRNKLPNAHILPVDRTIMGAEGADNRVTVHFHGGVVPWISDGGPYTWFRPKDGPTDNGPFYGPSAEKGRLNIYKLLDPTLKVGQAEYYYPMNQSARFGWFHDHAMGTTRLNAYAGMASALLVRDNFERGLVAKGMPDFIEKGGREIPIVIQDKVFQPEGGDPAFPGSQKTHGCLWYPYRYDPARYAKHPDKRPEDLAVSAIPEMFGDTMLVNGVAYPRASVEPRRYRLRVLNATQARFLNLQLYVESAPGTGLPDFTQPGPDFLVIGTEGGFLARPVVVPSGRQLKYVAEVGDREVDPADPGGSLLTGPAERWDILVDFAGFEDKHLVLYNDAPGPFPAGDGRNDGPVVGGALVNQVMLRIDVAATTTGPADPPLMITPATPLAADPTSGIDPAIVGSWATNGTAPLPIPRGAIVRDLTLNEIFDAEGRLVQMLGSNIATNPPAGYSLPADMSTLPPAPRTMARAYDSPTTEWVLRGTTEVWRITNLTGDVHPMHFHLVNAQVLSRQPFTDYQFGPLGLVGRPTGLGAARGPDPTEVGWKDTVRMNPMEVTTVAMRFDLPAVPFDVPPSPRTGGNEYVWHCHILEHEEHDMMRPMVVLGTNPKLG